MNWVYTDEGEEEWDPGKGKAPLEAEHGWRGRAARKGVVGSRVVPSWKAFLCQAKTRGIHWTHWKDLTRVILRSPLGFIKIIWGAALWPYMKGVISLESVIPGWCDRNLDMNREVEMKEQSVVFNRTWTLKAWLWQG